MIIQGDAKEKLKKLEAESVDCCITSPPYFGLRSYNGGDAEIGLEQTPEEYVQKLVEIYREVWRVLKKDGTCWLNLGDSYAGSGKGRNADGTAGKSGTLNKNHKGTQVGVLYKDNSGFKPKDLIGIPWQVAFALRADGWYLRQDIIWSKPNPMPESVTDRCTKAHEYVFLLTKSQRYFYDSEAVKEPVKESSLQRNKYNWNSQQRTHSPDEKRGEDNRGAGELFNENGRNKRSVWTINTKPFKEAHFAVFPEALIEPMIKTTRKNATILDPFTGAGTTGVVSKKLNRNFIGIELNKEYCQMAEKRIAETPKSML